MNLPCILKTTGGHVVCLFENGFGYHLDGQYKGIVTDDKFYISSSDKNITAEHLANTYSEVKSKKHAGFIVNLCENAGFNIQNDYFDGVGFFYVFKRELVFSSATPVICAKITIPLPPECDKPPIGGGQSMDYNNCRCSTAPALNDEWPKVGDEVEVCFESIVIGGKLLALTKEYAILSQGQGEQHFHLNSWSLVKPKTPEQELRDFLYLLWRENNEDFDDFADIAVLHLAKKGEGDE